MNENKKFSIEEIISSELVSTCYQPLISIKRKQIVGFEALSRGVREPEGSFIPPGVLIEEAEKYGLILELDRLFRKKALENFRSYHSKNQQSLLSVNLGSSAIRTGLGSKHFLKSVEKYRIDPSCIIIEILESEVEDINVLVDFVQQYRSQGFMIAMDDFGAGFSNWDRIIKLKPDIIKLDMSIIRDIDSDFLKQEVARSLIKLSHNTGSLVVAEGIETEDEALKMLELNADILQGFFLALPLPIDKLNPENISKKIDDISESFRDARNLRLKLQEKDLKEFSALTDRIIKNLQTSDTYLPEQILMDTAAGMEGIECIYILDEYGIQISETVVSISIKSYLKSRIFHPDDIYSDQSNKDYYFNLVNGNDRFISEPYISSATGNLCITISRKYLSREREKRILCVDIKK
ncbi:MAG TPA: EAL domain-containing protein [Spirochaetota bacterium]|nr:EAL domain-containing protein [Spirochaetota bacterium]HPS85546.1 EAL domain-containing protein [Spirochaetota bacterium]